MKHKSTIFANGLCTPPCGSSQSKSTRFSLLTSFLLFFLLFSGNMWGDNLTFVGDEIFYFDKISNSSGWGTVVANDADVYLEFANSGSNQTKSSAAQWENQSEGILKVTVPSGTYNQVRIVRGPKGNPGSIWNTFAWIDLQTGKNQILNGGSWSTYVVVPCDNPKPAADMYMAGQGFPDISWNVSSITMSWDCDNGVYYKTFTNLTANNNMTYRFKLNPSTDTSWGSQLNSDAIDNSHEGANLTLKSDNDDKRITFDLAQNADVTIYTNGTKVWASIPKPEPDPEPAERTISTDYRLRGDLWVYDNSGNWAGAGHNPEITLKSYKETDGTYTFSYIAPVADKNRFTVMIGGGADKTASLADGSTSGVTVDGVKYKFNVSSSPKQVDIVFNPSTDKAQVVLSDYTPNTEGWYFKCESAIGGIAADTKTALNSSGILTLSSVSAGTYHFYICNNDAELYWGQNKFGGCYVDQTNSTASLISSKTADAKFDGKQWPIKEVSNRKVKMVVSAGDAGKDVRISFDGGKIILTAIAPVAPHTVTIHPNNGESTFTMNVADGGTISSIAATYGNGTAKWYEDEDLTQEFILGTSTVTEDMDLYAKWGVSGNFYIGGDMWMHEKNGNNWAYYSTMAMTTTDGVASVTYIAPKGRNRFEILTTRNNWSTIANQGSGLIAASTPTLSWAQYGPDNNYHFVFDLDAPKKVTIRYNGKVSVTAEDYDVVKTGWTVVSPTLFGHGSDDNADYANNNTFMSGYNMTEGQMDANGERTFLNVAPGTYKFWIGKYNTDMDKTKQQIEVFGAANVDIANSSLTGYGSLADVNNPHISRNIPQDDKLHRRVQFTLNQRASIKIAFDGGKITVNLLPKYTVTFNSNDGSEVASQSVFEGTTATEPSAPTKAGYEFVKWQLSGADYDFSSAVTGNITLDAVWAYKAVSSVALNESEHTTWVGNSDFVLTLTKNPSDLITKSVVWSSDNTSAVSVSNGTVHAEGVGTATITCTVTDQFDNVRTATCDVTVAPCEMTTDALYSMTVTSYNSSIGSSATLNGLWNESSDNTEPATFRIVKLKLSDNNYIYDDNGTVKMSTDALLATAQWYEIPIGENFSPDWTGSSFALYEFKNVSTGKYMRRSDVSGGGGDWRYYTTITDNRPEDGTKYQFFYDNTHSTHLVCRANSNSSLQASYCLHRCNSYMGGDNYNNCPMPNVPCGTFTDPDGNTHTKLHETVVVDPSYANPNYKASQMNSSYYRMKADATVRANLENALQYGSIITVRLYADAATSVKLQTAAGDDVETINLSADAAREYSYTVAYGSELVGESAFIIKAADNHAGIASIEVTRMHAASPDDPALTWDADLSSGVTQSALAGTFQHVASSALSEGAIHYVSSDPSVATVAADGTVTPIMAGSTTITAIIQQHECYAEASTTYDVTLTEPTLAELIAADAGAGITLTHDYAENIVIDKEITINGGGHTIGNLTVQMAGDLTLSGALTVNDFSIYAKAGNSSIHAESGQVRNAADYLTANGNAYFLYTVDPSGHVQYGWYDFTVPFPVDVMTGIKGIQESELKENFINETDYAIMEHLGEKQANGEYSYKKFRGVMQPNKLYSITLDDDDSYNTVRFQKTSDGELVAGDIVTLEAHDGGVATRANWNGVGNGTLHHSDANLSTAEYIQIYQSGDKTFKPYNKNEISLVVGTAFMVQQAGGTMTLNQASQDELRAPARQESHQLSAISIQIAREDKPFSDQLFITANEDAEPVYTPGVDVAKAGNIGNVNVPQIWTNAYETKLCAQEAQLINGKAHYELSLYAPADGTYTMTSHNTPANYTLYLTNNGRAIWNLSINDTYSLDLTKGTHSEYGLMIVKLNNAPTEIDAISSQPSGSGKVIRNGILYILHNGKVFNAQGAVMK